MKYIPTIATCPEWYKIHQGMCIRCYEPQPSSIPVEELPSMYYGNEKHPNLESIRKAHPEAFDTSKNNETSPSTPEVSWESSFEEKYGEINTELILVERGWRDGDRYKAVRNDIKDFIKSVEYEAYGRGFDSKLRISHMEDDVKLVKKIRETERKRVNDILDGMKKEGDDFQCFDTDCFGNRTPTVIEKRLSSQDESYNLALEQAKHLINNTQ